MITPNLCPACGNRNDCSMASADSADQPCWCYSVSIDPALLRALTSEQRDLACLCPRCANVQAQLSSAQSEHLT